MKKLLSLMLVLALVMSLAACGNTATETKPAETTPAETPAETAEAPAETTVNENLKLASIKDSGKLIVGTSADYPPYEFHALIDGQDQIVGFDIEFAKAIGEALGVEVEIQDMDFTAVLTGVETGLIDIGIAGINPDPERDKTMDFSDIYFKSTYTVLVKASEAENYKTLDDLKGKMIGAQLGTVQEEMANTQIEDAQVVALAKVTDLVLQLKTGLIDAIVVEVPVADSYAKQNEDIVTVPEIDFSESGLEGGSVVIAANGEVALLDEINKVIADLQSTGQIEAWYAEAVELADSQNE